MSAAGPPPSTPLADAPRILFFGMAGHFSALALAHLLAAGLQVAAVVLPAPAGAGAPPIIARPPPPASRRPLALLGPDAAPTILDLAWRSGLPAYAVGRPGDPATLATLADHRPDLICVACFPRRLPSALLARIPLGGVNLHPSLLPAGRGPDPRFWTFRHGLTGAGVTVHLLTDVLDAGPILAQAAFDVPEGMTGAAFDERSAALGGRLLADAALALAAGVARPIPQDEASATYAPLPTDADYLVTPDRPARWAFGFMRGVAGDGGPLAMLVDGRPLPVREALAYTPDGDLGAPARRDGATLWVQCRPGLVQVLPAPSSGPARLA